MRILAIDTTTESCSVAIWNNGKKHAISEVCPREHTRLVLPMVQQVLIESGILLNQLNALIFARGPGSFTGVRIGISIAQGLAMGANLPMISISTLATLAQGVFRLTGATKVLSAIDARMGEVYWGQYQRDNDGIWVGESTEIVLNPACINKHIISLRGEWAIAGTGWVNYPSMVSKIPIKLIDEKIVFPQAEDMLQLALMDFSLGKFIAVEKAKPYYLRNEKIWQKKSSRK
ncbi:tRNA (adenosine(37)-N6)-threonylcarbamoyltransferase complex dimerization subunit type 1 TsaB [Candidatus Profftia tarda]|nr:tRNA (adenosine(37)-N6)-threonylcarbamoyltransferase complex dimerization subunit type 1 TsaB [Candidatus Profftia tarda]